MVIASGAVDRGHLSPIAPLSESPSSSSFFSQDLVPTERQVGFWKSSESMVDHKGSKPIFTSPLDKAHPIGSSPAGGLEHQRGQAFKGKLGMLNLGPVLACLQEGRLLLNHPVLINMCKTMETAFHPAPSLKSSVENQQD